MMRRISTISQLGDLPDTDIRRFIETDDSGWDLPDSDQIYEGHVNALFRMPSDEVLARFSGEVRDDVFYSDTGFTREVMNQRLKGVGIFSILHNRLVEVLQEAGVETMKIETAKSSTAKFFIYKGGEIVKDQMTETRGTQALQVVDFLHWRADQLRQEVEININLSGTQALRLAS